MSDCVFLSERLDGVTCADGALPPQLVPAGLLSCYCGLTQHMNTCIGKHGGQPKSSTQSQLTVTLTFRVRSSFPDAVEKQYSTRSSPTQ
jgi:hypothetical protein